MTNLYSIIGRQTNGSGNKLKKGIIVICQVCKKEFTKRSHNAKYCSKECLYTKAKNEAAEKAKTKKPSRHVTYKESFYFPPPDALTGNGLVKGSKQKPGKI